MSGWSKSNQKNVLHVNPKEIFFGIFIFYKLTFFNNSGKHGSSLGCDFFFFIVFFLIAFFLTAFFFTFFFADFFFFITGFHGFHVFSGVVINVIIFFNVILGTYERRGHYEMVEKVGLYWHFVDLVWVFVFTFFYLV